MRNGRAEVVIVGGGLAGIAAACELLDRGLAVTLVERRPFLGGRTYSVRDQHTGVEVDNGQHVFMGCCTEYIRLLDRLGVRSRTHLQKRLRVLVGRPGAAMTALEGSRLPGPLHLLPSFLRYSYLSLGDKLLVLYGLASIRRTSPERRRALDDRNFYDWLVAHRQTERATRHFWNLVIQPTLNDDVWSVSAELALMVFQEGLLRGRAEATIGYATVGLSRLLAQTAQEHIQARGGRLLLGHGAQGFLCDPDGVGVTGLLLADGEVLRGDLYVSAVPHQVLPSLLPEVVRRSPFFAGVQALGSAPIVNVHLWYDRPVADFDFAAFLDSEAQWVFNKGAILGQDEGRRLDSASGYLDVSISGARQFVDLAAAEIARRVIGEVAAALPRARGAQLLRHLVIKQPEATFAAAPGCGRLRPPSRTPLPNLFLAGDWTDTGWPATMEGAVRSGLACAQAIGEARVRNDGTQATRALHLV